MRRITDSVLEITTTNRDFVYIKDKMDTRYGMIICALEKEIESLKEEIKEAEKNCKSLIDLKQIKRKQDLLDKLFRDAGFLKADKLEGKPLDDFARLYMKRFNID